MKLLLGYISGILVQKNHFNFYIVLVFSKHFHSNFYTVQMQSFLFLFYLVRESF